MTWRQRLRSDFSTITIALIPVAIVIDIVIGQIVGRVLKLPLYLDSIGTILVGVVAGPAAGAITGALANVLWGILSSDPTVIPFAITAFAIGLVAGLWAHFGWFKRELPLSQGLILVLIVSAILVAIQAVNGGLIGAGLAIGFSLFVIVLTALRLFPALVAIGGVLTGIISAIISAPIAAFVFGGVTGSGTDVLVALFRATGANSLQANLAQGLVSDPFDKFVSFIVVWLILRGLSRRLVSQMPRAENIV